MAKSLKVITSSNDVYAPQASEYQDVVVDLHKAEGRGVELAKEWNELHIETIKALRREQEDEALHDGTLSRADKVERVLQAVHTELGALIVKGHGYPIIMLEYLHIVESVIEGALVRALGKHDTVRLGVYLGTASSIALVLREYVSRHGEAVDSVELGRLRDVAAALEALGSC